MTAYLAIMANGESVDAVRIGTHFESLTGEILDPISFVNFDLITRDQYAFEADFKKYTLKVDFSKYESLVYRNSLTDAAYKLWRKPEINAFDSKYLKQSFVDKINFGWSVWQEQTTPEGFVLVPKKLSDELNDHLWDFMTDNFISTNEDGDPYIACDDFDLRKFYSEIIEAQEQSHEH